MKLFNCVLLLFFSTNVWAGATNAIFTCKSASGRTSVDASVPGDFAEHNVKFKIDGQEIKWYDEVQQVAPYNTVSNSIVEVLGELRRGNYHFVIFSASSNTAVIKFSAVPGSVSVRRTSNGERGSLKAVVIGQDPRHSDGRQSPHITVDCKYVYEI